MSEETKDLQRSVDSILSEMETMSIGTDEEYTHAGQFLVKVKETIKVVKNHFEPQRKETYQAYQEVLSATKAYTDKLDRADKAVNRIMREFMKEKERQRIEAEKERRRIEEQKRREEEERRLNEAIENGDEEILEEPIDVEPEPEEEVAVPEIEGVSYFKHWTYEIIDPAKINPEFMVPDKKKIGATVKALKGQAQSILGEGVQVLWEKRISTRTSV